MTELAFWALQVVLLAAALRGPRWAMMVLAFSVPISRRMPAIPVPLLNYQNLLVLAAILSYAMHPPAKGAPGGRIRHAAALAVLGVLFTASFINTVATFTPKQFPRLWDPYRNAQVFRSLLMCFGVYALTCLAVRTRDDLLDILKAGVAGSILAGVHSAYEFLILRPGRVTGYMDEPNNMGSFLACSVTLLLAMILVLPRSHLLWWPSAIGCAAGAVGLLGTLSRGAYVAAAAGFLVITLLANRRVLAVGIAAMALNALWLPDVVKERIDSTIVPEEAEGWRFREGKGDEGSPLIALINEELNAEAELTEEGEAEALRLDGSVQSRLVTWTVALEVVADYPLGVGFGVFPWYMHYYSNVVRFKATHNIYLKIATETGILALLVFLYAVFLLGRDALRVGRAAPDPEIRALGLGMFTYLITLMVSALSVDLFFQVEVNGHFWAMMGALAQAPLILRPAAEPAPAAGGATLERPLYELVR